MRRILPLCLVLAACGTDTPPVERPSDPAPVVTVEGPDSAAVGRAGGAAAASVADEDDGAGAVGPPPSAAASTVDPTLVNGHGGRSDWEDEEGIELYDLAAIPLADALRERYFNVLGGTGESILFEDDGSGRSGRATVSSRGTEDDIGTWRLDGGTLTLDTPGRGTVGYTIAERSERGMVFMGPDGDLRVEDTAG